MSIIYIISTTFTMYALQVSDHLAGCLLKSVYQNPDNGFSSDRALDRDDVRRLVRYGVGVARIIWWMVYV